MVCAVEQGLNLERTKTQPHSESVSQDDCVRIVMMRPASCIARGVYVLQTPVLVVLTRLNLIYSGLAMQKLLFVKGRQGSPTTPCGMQASEVASNGQDILVCVDG